MYIEKGGRAVKCYGYLALCLNRAHTSTVKISDRGNALYIHSSAVSYRLTLVVSSSLKKLKE